MRSCVDRQWVSLNDSVVLAAATPISAATCATGRPVSITGRAACSRNAGVNFLRLPDILTSFPRGTGSPTSQVSTIRGQPHCGALTG
jgi:hypothetical protein